MVDDHFTLKIADNRLYALEKFTDAVYALAGCGSIKARVWEAFTSIHPVKAGDFTDPELRSKHDEIMRRLTAVQDGSKEKGYAQSTLEAMADMEVQEISRLIVDVALRLRRTWPIASS